MPDELQGSSFIELKVACPRCGGKLEQAVLPDGGKGEVKCSACAATWAEYKEMFRESLAAKSKPPALDRVQDILMKGKSVVRNSRNVVERIRGAQRQMKRAVDAIKNLREEGSVEAIGDCAENLLDQVILALEDVKDMKVGKMNPLAGEEDEKEGE